MVKLVLAVLCLALFVDLSRQDCNSTNSADCVYSSQDCSTVEAGKCCRQAAQVIALAAASARACAYAYVSAHSAAFACASAQAYTAVAACATAHVCITQSVALAINAGRCCEINSTVAANATSYASAVALASASAYARASAAASASANAVASASAAGSLYTFAQTLVESSCCDLNLKILNTVEAVGNFSSQAQVAAEASAKAAVSARASADACAYAADSVSATTAVFLSAGINNCCKANTTQLLAQNSSAACNAIVEKHIDLYNKTEDALDGLIAGIDHVDEITDPVALQGLLCTPECKDALVSCCFDTTCNCTINRDTCCLAAEVYTEVALDTHAIVNATAYALAYVAVQVDVRAKAVAAIRVAAFAAANATLLLNVNVKSCCSITITVSTTATSLAKSIAQAFAAAKAWADAAAGAQAQAQAIANAVASANAHGFALATLSYQGCCGQSCCHEQACCNIASIVKNASATAYNETAAQDAAESVSMAQDQAGVFLKVRASDTTNVVSIVKTQVAYILQCCCCTTAKPTVTTKKLSFASTLSFSFGK